MKHGENLPTGTDSLECPQISPSYLIQKRLTLEKQTCLINFPPI